jgi:hypothetical protein
MGTITSIQPTHALKKSPGNANFFHLVPAVSACLPILVFLERSNNVLTYPNKYASVWDFCLACNPSNRKVRSALNKLYFQNKRYLKND